MLNHTDAILNHSSAISHYSEPFVSSHWTRVKLVGPFGKTIHHNATAFSTQFLIDIFAARAVLKWRSRPLAKPLQWMSQHAAPLKTWLSFSTLNHFSKHLATRVFIEWAPGSTRLARQFLNCINHFLFEYFISPKATCPFVLWINLLE